MCRPLPAVLSLLLLSPALIAAAPPAAHCGHSSNAACHAHPISAWRRISDALINRIWGVPEEHQSLRGNSQLPISGQSGADRKLIARYGEDIVLRFNVTSAGEAEALAEASDVLFLDVWEANQNWVDIRIAKDVVPSLLGLLPKSLQNAHVPLMQNLDLTQAILDSYPSPSSTSQNDRYFSPSLKPSSHSENIFFQDYQPLSVITPWMSLMASMFPTHVRLINIGITYEGRDMPALRVGVHPTNNDQPSKPRQTILITAGTHAREWISTSTVNYIAWSLITSYGKDSHITHLLEAFDFVFVPTLNPDGYVYSWETDRLWRKNRQTTSLRFCRGVDLDRSYSYQWDGSSAQSGAHTTSNPCSEAFAGDAPFDGVEARRFADWARNETENNNVEFIGLLDLHSYSQQILYPYSYSCVKDPPTIEALEELAFGLAKAMHSSHKGHEYQVTSACEGNVAMVRNPRSKKQEKVILPRIEPSGGSALDWFYHELKVRYTYQIKLRDTGSYGFLLPKENIVPTGREMLSAVLYLGRFLQGQVGLSFEESVWEADGEVNGEESVKVEKELEDEEVRRKVEDENDDSDDDAWFELRRRRRR